MRLDDINAFLDVKHAHDRMARRAGIDIDTDVQYSSMTSFREAATLTDSSIKREPLSSGSGAIFSFVYGGVKFWYMSYSGEVV